MKPIRLCVFIPDLSDGGAQRQCALLVNELQHHPDICVTLVRYREAVHDTILDDSRIDVRFLKANSHYDPRVVLELVKIFRATNCNIVMSWLHASDIFAYFARKLAPEVRWILTERNSQYPKGIRFEMRRRLGRHADAIISNSRAGDGYWAGVCPRYGRYTVSNILPSEHGNVVHGGSRNAVLVIGRLEEQKDPVRAATVLCVLAAREAQLSCFFVGDGSLRTQIADVIVNSGLEDRVQMLGFRKNVDVFLRRARVVLSVSRYEGQPNVLIEAVVAGVPIVASAIPEHVELLGVDYPYLVSAAASADEVASVLKVAMYHGNVSELFAHANNRLSEMEPAVVGRSYLQIMLKMVDLPR